MNTRDKQEGVKLLSGVQISGLNATHKGWPGARYKENPNISDIGQPFGLDLVERPLGIGPVPVQRRYIRVE